MRQLVTKFEKYGSVSDLPRNCRGDNVNDDDFEAVLEAMNQLKAQGVLPSTSNIVNEVNRSKFCVWHIFRKELKFKPYKIQTAQRLTDVHHQRCLNFSKKFLSKVSDDDSFLKLNDFFLSLIHI